MDSRAGWLLQNHAQPEVRLVLQDRSGPGYRQPPPSMAPWQSTRRIELHQRAALCRGQHQDYDRWAELGNRGWDFASVLPYFKKSEDQSRGEDKYHGIGGPLKVSDLRLRRPIADHFIAGATECQIPLNDDYNGAQQEGIGYFQQTAHKGFRCSTAKAFLKPARKRSNLTVITNAQTHRVLVKDRQALGIEYEHSGKIKTALAGNEVILSCLLYTSPSPRDATLSRMPSSA